MALSVDYLYKFCLDLMKKNQAGGLRSKAFEYEWNDAQSAYQDSLLGNWQKNSAGKTGMNTGLILDETILQKLAPFTKPSALTITAGNVTKPTDFVYRLAFRVNGVDCYKINQNQIANVNASVIDPPSVTDNMFYFVEYQDYYYILPHTLPTVAITTADLDYIKTPDNIIWGYTFDSQGRQVYDPGASVQPAWDNNSCREITKRMFENLGVSFHDKDFENFGKVVQATGV
jgi:hypothetical protein